MRNRRLVVAAWVCGMMWVGQVGRGQAAESAQPVGQPAANAGDEARKKEIQALIEQLSSPDEAVRAKAQDKLVSMGDEARAALEAHVRAKAAEQTAVAKIDVSKVASPMLVTLDLKDATPQAAAAELAKQSGYDIGYTGASAYLRGSEMPSRMTLSVDRQPFFSVLRELCIKGGMKLTTTATSERRMQLVPAGASNPMRAPAVVIGPVMILATNVRHEVDLAEPETAGHPIWLGLQAWVEPKAKVLASDFTVAVSEAVDERGNSLAVAQRPRLPLAGQASLTSTQRNTLSLTVPLRIGTESGKRIARFKGNLRFLLQSGTERVEFPEPLGAKQVTKTLGGLKLTLLSAKRADLQYQAEVLVDREGMAMSAFYEAVRDPGLRLVGGQNREYACSARPAEIGTEQARIRATFTQRSTGGAQTPEPEADSALKIVWEIPARTVELPVDFEFRDLPLW